MADTGDLKSPAEERAGSSPALGTKVILFEGSTPFPVAKTGW
jgi:hypothetical protein